MVPNGWNDVKLGEVIKHQKGYAFKSDSYTTEGVRIIRISDTTRNSIHDKSPVYIDENETASLSQYKLNAEDIILSTVGSRPHLLDSMVGKAVKIPIKDKGALLNQNLVKVVPKDNLITNNYLFSMITKSKFNYFISTLVRGNANQVSITLKELFAYNFPLPPLSEQQKIAKILSTWDKTISITERLIENSTQQKKALMQQLLTGKKRLLNESGKRFEGEWEEYPVGEICQSIVPGRNKPKKFDGHIPWVTTPEFQGRYIPSKLQKNYISQSVIDECGAKLVPKGAVVIAAVGDLGLTAMASEIIVLNQQLHAFVCGENVYNEYLFYWLSYQKPYMESIASKTTIQYMNKKNCESIPVKLPTLEEQQKIAIVLTNADQEIELLEQQLADLQQEKKALMQVLLTGKVRVLVDGEA